MFGRPRTALLLYAVAMGYLEAAVVVYLRAIYYPEGFSFPLKPMDAGILGVEIGREAATVVMIFAVAWAAARSGWQTLTGFALVIARTFRAIRGKCKNVAERGRVACSGLGAHLGGESRTPDVKTP